MSPKSNKEIQQRIIEIRADVQSGDSRNWKSLVQADIPWLLSELDIRIWQVNVIVDVYTGLYNEYNKQQEEIIKLRAELKDYHDGEQGMAEMEKAEKEVERQMQERIDEERNNYLYDRDDEQNY